MVWLYGGSSHANESMVTLESEPVLKEFNSLVIGGMINLHGALHIKATKVGSNTVLNQIISLMEAAQMSKAPIQKFADFVLNDVCDLIVNPLRDLIVEYIFQASLEAYVWILLDGGPSHVFLDTDVAMMREDLIILMVGNHKLLTEGGVLVPVQVEKYLVEMEEYAKTRILVAYAVIFVGVLVVSDPLKREAAVVVLGLKKMGILPVMVTGDNFRTARAITKVVGITR